MGTGRKRAQGKLKVISLLTMAVFGLFTYWAMGAQADDGDLAPVESAPNGREIPGSYVVFYEDGRSADRSLLDRGATQLGNSGNAFSAQLSRNDLLQLRRDPSVESIVEDFYLALPRRQETTATFAPADVPWGLDRSDQRSMERDGVYNPTGHGDGVDVYVIDTGVDRSHPEFAGRIGGGVSFVGEDDPFVDCFGHGTSVASAAAGSSVGTADGVWIYSLKVGDHCSESEKALEYSGIIAAVEWLIDNHNGPTVANMSFGMSADGLGTSKFTSLVEQLVAEGITVVTSAGNDDTNACSQAPALLPDTVTVGSTTWEDNRSSFSNFGSCVDIFAPGSSIKVADAAGGYRRSEGTSLSAPYVAGAAAIYLAENRGATPAAVRNFLYEGATIGALNDVQGSPNRLLHVQPLKGVLSVGNEPDPCPDRLENTSGSASACDLAEGLLSVLGGEEQKPGTCSPSSSYGESGYESVECVADAVDQWLEKPLVPADDCAAQGPGYNNQSGAENCVEFSSEGYPENSNGSICYGPVTPGPGTDAAQAAFGLPIKVDGCGVAWDDQLGHQCRWVDSPRQGWECFGAVAGAGRPTVPQPTQPLPAPGHESADQAASSSDAIAELAKEAAAEAAEAASADQGKAAEAAPSSGSSAVDYATGSICRSDVIEGLDLEEAREAFGAPVDQGGCGMAWNDAELGHQCQWIDGSPQGWQCFGQVS